MNPEGARYQGSPAKKTANTRPGREEVEARVIVFSMDSATVAWGKGVARCDRVGICRGLKGFNGGPTIDLWTSESGNQIAALQEKKLGLSLDGGATAVWRDLPTGQPLWIRGMEREGDAEVRGTLVLGTSAGLFLSRDAGQHWVPARNGLPVGRMEAWLADSSFWLVSERSGGQYLSMTEGASWRRIDKDEERGRLAGLVKIGEREVLVGSESEGILEVTLPSGN